MKITRQHWQIAGLTLCGFGLLIVALRLMGRIPFGANGIGIWTGNPQGVETSQLLADPYSWSHFLHGILLYWLLRKFLPRLTVGHWFLLALFIEVGWEIWENTPFIINRYREGTASPDYYGDSIWNSSGDVLFMIGGFVFARRISWKWVLALLVAIELLMLYFYRDNLTLNILMLIFPIDAIREWQMGFNE